MKSRGSIKILLWCPGLKVMPLALSKPKSLIMLIQVFKLFFKSNVLVFSVEIWETITLTTTNIPILGVWRQPWTADTPPWKRQLGTMDSGMGCTGITEQNKWWMLVLKMLIPLPHFTVSDFSKRWSCALINYWGQSKKHEVLPLTPYY